MLSPLPLLVVSLLAADPTAVSEAAPAAPHSRVVRARRAPAARLRGDFEPPTAVVVGVPPASMKLVGPLVRALADAGPVQILLQRGADRARARRWLRRQPPAIRDGVTLLEHEVDSPWVRDYGPLQLRGPDDTVTWLDARYPERPRDDLVPGVLGERWGVPVTTIPWSLDGGALASNGDGLCVTTLEYADVHAIPTAGRAATGELLPKIGCRALAFVPALPDEPTHHVDLFVQFVDAHTVAVASVDPSLDADAAERLDETVRGIEAAATATGTRIRVVRPPMGIGLGGDWYPYLNGLRLRDAYLMPVYHPHPSPTETRARTVLQEVMPGVDIVRIPADELTDLGGAVHCLALGLVVGDRTPAPVGTPPTVAP